jgi:predicted permease
MTLNDRIYRVIGVMGPDFRWPRAAELWASLGLPRSAYAPDKRFNENFLGYARLHDGVPFARGNAWIQVLADQLKKSDGRGPAYARDSGWGMFALPLADFVAGDTRRPLLILMGAVAFVLLIACSNIAGLMLARTSGRAREIAVRVALGAGRWQLMRQTAAESLSLAFGGALAGLAVAYAGVRLLLVLSPEGTAAGLSAGLDVRVVGFTAMAAAVSAILFGLAPAWQVARFGPGAILKGAGRSGMVGRGRQRLRAALVVCQTALALLLLVGAGLFLRSLASLEAVAPGFQPRGVMTAALALPHSRYADDARRIQFYRSLTERLSATSGVTAAALGLPLPFSGGESSASFAIQEHPTGPGDPGPHGDIRLVSPNYFRVLSIPLKAGRYFTDQDQADTQFVAVIDENLARQYWPGENPIGQHIRGGVPGNTFATVVGVVGHIHHSDLASDSGKGVYYYSMWQRAAPFTFIAAKASGDPAGPQGAAAAAIRAAVRVVDPAQPVHDLRTMSDLVENSLAPRRFVVRLLGFFACAALFLSALGLYGLIGYSVTQRTQEIGIRMALGAHRRQVLALVVGQGIRLAAVGAIAGIVASLALGRWLGSLLFSVSAFDPVTLAVTAAVLISAAALASYLPARRAALVDASEALRWE